MGLHGVNEKKRWSPRRRIVGALLSGLFGRESHGTRLRPEEIGRVLLIRYDRLGDAVVTTPVIETLYRLSTDIEIDVLGSPHNGALLEADHRVSRVHVWDGSPGDLPGVIRACRRRAYDLTLQLILNRTTNPAIIAGLATPRGRVVGKGHAYNARLLDHLVTSEPATQHFADQTYGVLLEAIDFGEAPPEAPPFQIDLPEKARNETEALIRAAGLQSDQYLLLNASAGAEKRSLDVKMGTELARGLKIICENRGLALAISGSPEESAKVEAIAAGSDATVLRFPSVIHLCCGIATARLLVTPDTGPVHIASATNTPVIAYYSEHDKPAGWGPRGDRGSVVIAETDGEVGSVDIGTILENAEERIGNVELRIMN